MTDLSKLRALFTRKVEDEPIPALTFCVWGHPQPAGSKRALPNKGRPGAFVVVDDNPKARIWKHLVRKVAADVRALVDYPVLEGAVAIKVTFLRERPKAHLRKTPRGEIVRGAAPVYPITKPDTLKLMRAVEDALTGVLYGDDAQIVTQTVSKIYARREGVEITVWPVRHSQDLR
jgi:Holliday junction resolvase RusA-like endonuclease